MPPGSPALSAHSSAADLLAAIEPADGGCPVMDPATGELVGRAPEHSVADLETAVTVARGAQPGWASRGHAERSALLDAAADAVEASAEALAELLSREQGKPLNGPNARFEVGACAAWLRAAAALPLEPEMLVEENGTKAELHYRPLGDRAVELADDDLRLAAGPGARARPGAARGRDARGGREVGERLAAHPDIAKVMFTGSTATGKAIICSSADTVKRLTLELGGNDAGIVLPDADPAAIAEGLFWGRSSTPVRRVRP